MAITLGLVQISIILGVAFVLGFIIFITGRMQGEKNMIRIMNDLKVRIPDHILARIETKEAPFISEEDLRKFLHSKPRVKR